MIETPRLILRRFTLADAPAMRTYRNTPAIARYQAWRSPLTHEDAEHQVLLYAKQEPAEAGWFQYAVEHKGTGHLAGDLGVRLDDDLLQAEIGFTLAPAFQRQGYGTEMVLSILDHLFAQGMRRVYAECDIRNTRSAALLERTGFRHEGTRTRPTININTGERTDMTLYELSHHQRTA
ncbi:GNAT family N-acetyltransferase [Streptomyces sp. WZ-12]|uniref:GNAT family N-acetyltransferase n=1 Tax=Streptomyces sp. WZ-12 TaxID=3030210 RepID=UPI002381769F|nr:GNAT family N-acetyltransferase [Streptomyces sp. WZ-12]